MLNSIKNPKSIIQNPKLKRPMISWKRTLRTASSERFLAQREGKDVAAVDLHYLASGTVAGTVILLKEAEWQESVRVFRSKWVARILASW
jgi:hypothetical protein